MPENTDTSILQTPFTGFSRPESNFFRLPNEWTDITAGIVTGFAEQKVVEYVLKHTWGYSEFDVLKKITTDEFINGRKRKNGTRIDVGTGLSKPSVIQGLNSAVQHGLLEVEIDDTDKARIKKYYKLRMKTPIEEGESDEDEESDVKNLYIGVKKFDSDGKKSLHRSEKDTLRNIYTRNSKIKIQRNVSKQKQGYQSFQAIGDLLKQKTEQQGREVLHLPESIEAGIDEISENFNDAGNRRSNRTRVLHLYQVSGKTEDRFTSCLYEARSITKQQGSVKNKMPYFFRVLEDITGVQQRAVNTFSNISTTPQNALQQTFSPETGESSFTHSNRNQMPQRGTSP